MPKKRKRRRTRLKPGPILVLAALAALILGILDSPISSASQVSVTGAKKMDMANIESILGTLNNIPWVRVNRRWVETRVQRIEAVDHATYTQNLFGRGHLIVSYRQPVARVRANEAIGLDATGVMFETDMVPQDLPVVVRPPSAHNLPLTIAGGFPSGRVAELAIRAKAMDPSDKLTIWFNPEGALCLNMGAGLVILGSSDDLDLKLQALKETMDREPGVLAKPTSLNLTDPSHPVLLRNKPQ